MQMYDNAAHPMAMSNLADENEYVVMYLPPWGKAFVFRVVGVDNKGREDLNYGPFPTTTSTNLGSYSGGSPTVAAAGEIPARSYTNNGLSFPLPSGFAQNAFDDSDMFYLDTDMNYKLFHTLIQINPVFLRADVQLPIGVRAYNFQNTVPMGVDQPGGYSRGFLNLLWIPRIHMGVRIGNDTNWNLRTGLFFRYREYDVEIPRDPQLVYNILTRKEKRAVHWVTMPINTQDSTITQALQNAYGFDGFPMYSASPAKEQVALPEYQKLMGLIKPGV